MLFYYINITFSEGHLNCLQFGDCGPGARVPGEKLFSKAFGF